MSLKPRSTETSSSSRANAPSGAIGVDTEDDLVDDKEDDLVEETDELWVVDLVVETEELRVVDALVDFVVETELE